MAWGHWCDWCIYSNIFFANQITIARPRMPYYDIFALATDELAFGAFCSILSSIKWAFGDGSTALVFNTRIVGSSRYIILLAYLSSYAERQHFAKSIYHDAHASCDIICAVFAFAFTTNEMKLIPFTASPWNDGRVPAGNKWLWWNL